MISKSLLGATVVLLLALIWVSNSLLKAKEQNGVLIQGIATAEGVNERQTKTIEELEQNKVNLLADIEAERAKNNAATAAIEELGEGLENAEADFNQRLAAAVAGMSDEELTCASEFVPDDLVISLHDETGSID